MQSSLFEQVENMLPRQGEAYLYPNFFYTRDSDRYLAVLGEEINWKQEPIKIFGKTVMQPRLTAWYGAQDKAYSYSGITMQPMEWTSCLLEIKNSIEKMAGVQFTNALLNCYRDGQDSMGWHRDNEKVLGINPVIGSVSFGVTRKFQFRQYYDKKIVESIELSHGSFLLMKGETQHYWEHRLPKANKVNGERINITFRVLQ